MRFAKLLLLVQLVISSLLLSFSHAAPLIVAHRGGTGDSAENTLPAIELALNNGADIIWVTVQLSKDGVPVLYRPSDLDVLTNGKGFVSAFTASELAKLDAAYQFDKADNYPLRGKGISIPTLQQVLKKFPKTEFFIDIKSPDAVPSIMAAALEKAVGKESDRVMFYSTESRYLDALPAHLARFIDRDSTRTSLLDVLLSQQCKLSHKADTPALFAYELRRDVEVVEKYTLGEGRSKEQMVWTPAAMSCFKSIPNAQVLLIGVNSQKDYQLASELGADYIMVDSPAMAKEWK